MSTQKKPPFCYAYLIYCAIQYRTQRRATVSDIFEHISSNYPFYKNHPKPKVWRNSIRRTLSTNDCFIWNPPTGGNRGGCWAVHESSMCMFASGNLRRRDRNCGPNYNDIGACSSALNVQQNLSYFQPEVYHLYHNNAGASYDTSMHTNYLAQADEMPQSSYLYQPQYMTQYPNFDGSNWNTNEMNTQNNQLIETTSYLQNTTCMAAPNMNAILCRYRIVKHNRCRDIFVKEDVHISIPVP
ncbi:hypothetical protein FKM82_000832 [Ascaphus truei]